MGSTSSCLLSVAVQTTGPCNEHFKFNILNKTFLFIDCKDYYLVLCNFLDISLRKFRFLFLGLM